MFVLYIFLIVIFVVMIAMLIGCICFAIYVNTVKKEIIYHLRWYDKEKVLCGEVELAFDIDTVIERFNTSCVFFDSSYKVKPKDVKHINYELDFDFNRYDYFIQGDRV